MFSTARLRATKVLAALLVTVLALTAAPGATAIAQNADGATPTIAELAVANADLSTLVTALTVATEAGPVDFLGTVSNPSLDLTVFAPTNAAFAALGGALDDVLADPSGALTDILLYHVLDSSQDAASLLETGTATTLLGDDLTIETRADGNVYINDSQVVISDVVAANGIIHVIDTVLLPPAPPVPTIAELAVATPELSTLVTALTVATEAGPVDFLGTVSDPNQDLTVFAPTNDAFAALGGALDDVLADPSGALTDILLYHVLDSSQDAASLLNAGTATTLLGENLTIETRADGNVYINDSQVTVADIVVDNGIVHVIDTVLLPPAPPVPTIAELAVATPELSTLVTALTVATEAGPVDFLGTVSDPNQDLTVFAPTNDAFAALGGALDDVLADPSGALTDILLYHVLGTSQDAASLLNAGTATTLLGDDLTIETRADGNVYINDSQVTIANLQAANGIIHVIDAVLLPPAPPTPSPVFDGARVQLISAVSGRYLDGDPSNVDTSTVPKLDDEWILEQTADGNWNLLNAARNRYLDADGNRRHFNVDLGRRTARGAEWEITMLDNGNYLLRTVDLDRYLDYDSNGNVDTSVTPKADDEWQIVLVSGV